VVSSAGDVVAIIGRGDTAASAGGPPTVETAVIPAAEAAPVKTYEAAAPAYVAVEPAKAEPEIISVPEPVEAQPAAAAWETEPVVQEPVGWAVAPAQETTPTTAAWEPSPVVEAAPAASYQPMASYQPTPAATPTASYEPTSSYQAASTYTPAPAAPAPAPEPAPVVSTPAGWYPDPSGRFEMRYWDGTSWTEHVSRAGQQFTDPPVA
jgi:hypothetical protein